MEIDAVDYNDWVEALKQVPRTKENAEKVTGLKLLEFYQGMRPETGIGLPSLATVVTQRSSETLRNVKAIDATLMYKWLEQWLF